MYSMLKTMAMGKLESAVNDEAAMVIQAPTPLRNNDASGKDADIDADTSIANEDTLMAQEPTPVTNSDAGDIDEHSQAEYEALFAESRRKQAEAREDATCLEPSLCTRCGIYAVNHRKSLRQRSLCCNKCPNHGPWCTMHLDPAASSVECENQNCTDSSHQQGCSKGGRRVEAAMKKLEQEFNQKIARERKQQQKRKKEDEQELADIQKRLKHGSQKKRCRQQSARDHDECLNQVHPPEAVQKEAGMVEEEEEEDGSFTREVKNWIISHLSDELDQNAEAEQPAHEDDAIAAENTEAEQLVHEVDANVAENIEAEQLVHEAEANVAENMVAEQLVHEADANVAESVEAEQNAHDIDANVEEDAEARQLAQELAAKLAEDAAAEQQVDVNIAKDAEAEQLSQEIDAHVAEIEKESKLALNKLEAFLQKDREPDMSDQAATTGAA